MHPLAGNESPSARDAAARLRYASGVRDRARRAALAPSLALVALGAVVLTHGVLKTVWPHATMAWIVLVAGVLAVRPAMRWLIARSEQRRGVQAGMRLRFACGAAGVVAAGIAIWMGASPVISATTAATAVAAYLAALPELSVAIVGAGLAGEAMIAHGLAPSVGELIIGVALIAAGAVGHARERQSS
jgi:hypothetical protein